MYIHTYRRKRWRFCWNNTYVHLSMCTYTCIYVYIYIYTYIRIGKNPGVSAGTIRGEASALPSKSSRTSEDPPRKRMFTCLCLCLCFVYVYVYVHV